MRQNIVERKIMWGDLDPLGIVYYPRYYEWMEASGHLFFESLGLTINDLWKERKIQFGLAETACRYSKPGRYHQELRIITGISDLNRYMLTFKHAIRLASDDSLMVTGFEKRVCMDVSDPERIKARAIPGDIYAHLEEAMRA